MQSGETKWQQVILQNTCAKEGNRIKMNFCILHQHLYQADGFQIPPQTQMLQRYRQPFDATLLT
jgi:hypothetical protein